jgi:hypothetical protein
VNAARPTTGASEPGEPPHRLRDLQGRDRLLAGLLFLAVLVPFVVSLVRAYHDGWVPSGDDANIATRALDVFSRHPPLTGLPSTTLLYGKNIYTKHPGPIEFYLLAVPVRLLGQRTGPLLGAAAINAGFVLIALWAIYRRAGLRVLLGAGLLMEALLFAAGTSVLSATVSSNMTMYATLCTAVLAWALADGDLALLPLTALVATYAAQQHLATDLVVVPLVILGVVALAISRVRVRARDRRRPAPFVVGAIVIAAVGWLPVAIDQIWHHPGNLTEILRFARDSDRPTQGVASTVTQLGHAIVPPSLLAMRDVTGLTLIQHANTARTVVALLEVAALVVVLVVAARRNRSLSRLALITLALLAVGLVNGANVPRGVEENRASEFRWWWAAAFLTWTTLGWAIVTLVPWRRRVRVPKPAAAVAVVTALALLAGATIATHGTDDVPRDADAFAVERTIDRLVLPHVDRSHPVAVVYRGGFAAISIGNHLTFRLVQEGVAVQLSPYSARSYGPYRNFQPDTHPSAIVISTGTGALPPSPGRIVAREVSDPEYERRVAQLVTAVAAQPFALAPDAVARANAANPGLGPYVASLFERFGSDARRILTNRSLLELVRKGYVVSPAVTPARAREMLTLLAHARTIHRSNRVRLSITTPAEVAAAPPAELTSPFTP